MASEEEEVVEFEVWTDEGGPGLFDEYAEEAPVAEEVVEPVKSVPTLSLPAWKEAVAGLVKAGRLDKGADYVTVRNAITEFQSSVGIRGIAEGIPTEETLAALKGA
jgi:hypothetical protein